MGPGRAGGGENMVLTPLHLPSHLQGRIQPRSASGGQGARARCTGLPRDHAPLLCHPSPSTINNLLKPTAAALFFHVFWDQGGTPCSAGAGRGRRLAREELTLCSEGHKLIQTAASQGLPCHPPRAPPTPGHQTGGVALAQPPGLLQAQRASWAFGVLPNHSAEQGSGPLPSSQFSPDLWPQSTHSSLPTQSQRKGGVSHCAYVG